MDINFRRVKFWFWFAVIVFLGLTFFINLAWVLDEDRGRAISYINQSDVVISEVGDIQETRLWKRLTYYGVSSDPGYKKMFFTVKGKKGSLQVVVLFTGKESNEIIELKILD
ncbi:hypothetical protein [Alcanivorax quisquiliarum]|uniref:Uncharacterized protein n=1 Tax=Alcanivorax quisquiliarum TaxID=2933565 RepID=A0ABT0E4J2_9GAMM|nr:hypothetical protein [Alcanivorax quisquiliarum]MCK0536735.1 hypothetical protein [Alcanivorax quisquiliarum]